MKKLNITNIFLKYKKYDFNENARYSNEILVFLVEIFLYPSLTESFLIMTVILEISIKIPDSAKYIICILTNIFVISPDNFGTVTKISIFLLAFDQKGFVST